MKTFQEEVTAATAVAQIDKPLGTPTGKVASGHPYFDVDDETFFSLHLKRRMNKQWFNKHYKDTHVAAWARTNQGKDFYLRHTSLDLMRKINVT